LSSSHTTRSRQHTTDENDEPCRDDIPTPTERRKKSSLSKSVLQSASQRLETLTEFTTGGSSRKHAAPITPSSKTSHTTTPKSKKIKARVLFKSPKSSTKTSASESSDGLKQKECHLQ